MPGKTADLRAALDAQARTIIDLFSDAGYGFIDPDILQPADIFLDRSGENIRSRTYVFTDPAGAELALRPDLTVPACRYYLEHEPAGRGEVRYCYSGPAFRFQPDGHDELRPREFDQVGLELFGAGDAETAEAEIIALTIEAVRTRRASQTSRSSSAISASSTSCSTASTCLGRWRQRLKNHFWRPQTFHETLVRLADDPGAASGREVEFMGEAYGGGQAQTMAALAERFEAGGIPVVGGRSVEEIAARVCEKAADREAHPLPREHVALIEHYLSVAGQPRDALQKIMSLIVSAGLDMSTSLAAFARRITLMQDRGIAVESCRFLAEFGRSLEYYTGFVFQIECDTPSGPMPIAGGGRYDGLMSDIGARNPVPAVGCAIHTERLLAAVRGEV